jgi:hypothetical protein
VCERESTCSREHALTFIDSAQVSMVLVSPCTASKDPPELSEKLKFFHDYQQEKHGSRGAGGVRSTQHNSSRPHTGFGNAVLAVWGPLAPPPCVDGSR